MTLQPDDAKTTGEPGEKDAEAMHHLRSHFQSGGHWWDCHGHDPPDWYAEQFAVETVADDAPQRCTDAEAPPVPEVVDWSAHRWYCCNGCGWPCINHEDSEAAQADSCWNCLGSD